MPTSAEDRRWELREIGERLSLDSHQVRRAARSQTLLRRMCDELEFTLGSDVRILDLGCGSGVRVCAFREAGVAAFGVDLKDRFELAQQLCLEDGLAAKGEAVFRVVDPNMYRFPFSDASFDFVHSDQVLEHVTDLGDVVSEIHRVLKPGGSSVHVYPPPWLLIEPHVFVPFAGAIQRLWWLRVWALLGIRTASQRGLTSTQVAGKNLQYLQRGTRYRSARSVEREFGALFDVARHENHLFLKHTPLPIRRFYPLLRLLPFATRLMGTFLQRVLWLVKKS